MSARLRIAPWIAALGIALSGVSCAVSTPQASSGSEPGPESVQLGQEFKIRVRQTAAIPIESALITFVKVTEDSRCPSGVQCAWAGQAKLVINVALSGGGPGDVELTLGGSSPQAATLTYKAYTLELHSLDPYPVSTGQIKPEDYVATLLMRKQ